MIYEQTEFLVKQTNVRARMIPPLMKHCSGRCVPVENAGPAMHPLTFDGQIGAVLSAAFFPFGAPNAEAGRYTG